VGADRADGKRADVAAKPQQVAASRELLRKCGSDVRRLVSGRWDGCIGSRLCTFLSLIYYSFRTLQVVRVRLGRFVSAEVGSQRVITALPSPAVAEARGAILWRHLSALPSRRRADSRASMGACGSTAASSSTSDPGVAPAPAATGEPPVKTPANYEAVPSANAAPLLPAETSVAPAADTTTKTVAADEVAVAEAPLPADASPEEISGKALLNTVLSTMLPSVRLAITDQLAKMYENSQFMPHEKGLSVEPVLNPSKPLVAGEVLRHSIRTQAPRP
jgi:hypothetical protein